MFNPNNPALKSWVTVSAESDFPIQNLPFGIFQTNQTKPTVGVAIGEFVLNIFQLAEAGFLKEIITDNTVFNQGTLNAFIALGKETTSAVRNKIGELLDKENPLLQTQTELCNTLLIPQNQVQLLLPIHIPNYTDFYSSKEHATNVGMMFRDPANALLPNWKHLPVGYHGRASSIVVSGTPIHRPKGQTKADADLAPTFGASKLVDFELEMAFVIGKETALGDSISTENAEQHIFGLMLFNDWSARDIQKWEYVPLGPFLAKNFGSTLSPWLVTLDALEPFRTDTPAQDPTVLPYLKFEGKKNYDIHLQVAITNENGGTKTVSNSNFKYMYWNMCQQLAHHTVNGCNVEVGDLYASGTISGPTPDSYGSMLEISWQGKNPVTLSDGTERKFIADNDTVSMRAFCQGNGYRIGFGNCDGKILPAK